MAFSLSDIADYLEGEVVGDHALSIRRVASIDDARNGDITFLSSPRLAKKAKKTEASALIVQEYLEGVPCPLLLVPDPHYAFARLLSLFHPVPARPAGVDPKASVHPGATLGEGVTLGPFVVVEEGVKIGAKSTLCAGAVVCARSEIGDETFIYPNVTIREGVKIGHRVIVHANSVIGSDGFGFVPHQGRHFKVPQVGGVVIEDDVEVGASVTIDRATLGDTVIRRGTKINNLVQIGHNVEIGEHCILVAQVGISGSVRIGNRVTLAGQVGVAGHLSIGDQTVVAAKSVVTKDIPAKRNVAGFPAFDHVEWRKATVLFPRLPEFRKKIRTLEDQIRQLERRLSLMEGDAS
jgi:UDP-3-O-[3-hydroxymyristoyl] glucosamine N-acyltransferase